MFMNIQICLLHLVLEFANYRLNLINNQAQNQPDDNKNSIVIDIYHQLTT